jgi:MSHA biogenesis protein MshI
MLGLTKKKQSGNASVGVDIYSDGIALAVKQNSDRQGRASLRCEFVSVQSPDEVPAALRKLVDKHNLKHQSVTVLMPADKYSLLQTSSPPMAIEEMRAAAKWKINDLISFPVAEAVVDVFEYPQAGQRGGGDRMLYVVVARRGDVKRNIDYIRDADLTLKNIDIGEFALRNVISRLEENKTGVIVLALAEHHGMLVFVKEDEVYLTRRLESGFSEIMLGGDRVHEEIVLELQRSLDFFESQFAQSLPRKLLIYPPDKVTGELMQYIHSHLSLEVEPLVLERLSGYVMDGDEESQSRCLLAVGAALREDQEGAA